MPTTRTMKAAQVPAPGADFQIVEREIPEPAAGQVRIKVQACGVCRSDSLTKEGSWPGIQYPRVPGHEVAGIVDAVGAVVSDAAVWVRRIANRLQTVVREMRSEWVGGAHDGLGPNGKLIVVGVSFDPVEVAPVRLMNNCRRIEGWAAGTPADSEDTLRFAELCGVRAMIETYALEKAGEAYARMMSGKAQFRVVLTM